MLPSTVPKPASRQLLLAMVRLAVFLLWISTVAAKKGGGRRGGGISSGSRGGTSGWSTEECGPACAIVLITIIGMIGLLVVAYCLWRYLYCLWRYLYPPFAFGKNWEHLRSNAEKEVRSQDPSTRKRALSISFAACTFRGRYKDSSHPCEQLVSQGTLYFKSQASVSGDTVVGHPFKSISGSGTDEDGSFTITEGLVSMETGKAFWIEYSREADISSLVTGHFSTDSACRVTFAGWFVCADGAIGEFSSFDVTPQDSAQDRAHDEGLEADITVEMTNGDYSENATESSNKATQVHLSSLFAAPTSQEKQETLPLYGTHESMPRPSLSRSNRVNDVPSMFKPPM